MENRQELHFAGRKILVLSIILVSWFVTFDVFSGEPSDFVQVLQRMTQAERETGYVGLRLVITCTSSGCSVREERVVHQPPDMHFIRVLKSVGETARSSRRDGIDERRHKRRGPRWHRGDGRSRRRHGPGRRDTSRQRQQRMELLTPKEIELLSQNYTFESTSKGEIAGYKTDLLTVTPRYDGRPSKHIWVARDNRIILRVEDYDPEGNLQFMSVYTEIHFQKELVAQEVAEFKPNGAFKSRLRREQSQYIARAKAEEIIGCPLVQPQHLPEGFELHHITLRQFFRSHIVHQLYTDGLMAFSLFESKGTL